MFNEKHEDLIKETEFMIDVVGFLCDYKKVLEHAIENAELDT